MSRAIASARQRRAGITQPEPPPPPAVKPTEQSGLTLQQVIALIDTRLVKLEKFMKESSNSNDISTNSKVQFSQDIIQKDGTEVVDITSILDDYNSRFMLLAEEIASLKDALLKLQTYTMDVNKMLLDERVNILSDLGEGEKSMFVMEDTTIQELDKLSDSGNNSTMNE